VFLIRNDLVRIRILPSKPDQPNTGYWQILSVQNLFDLYKICKAFKDFYKEVQVLNVTRDKLDHFEEKNLQKFCRFSHQKGWIRIQIDNIGLILRIRNSNIKGNVQCCRSGMVIPDPGWRFKKITDPGSKSASKNSSIFSSSSFIYSNMRQDVRITRA
jgi:hypothetical protein